MPVAAAPPHLPNRRPELLIRPLGDEGQCVVKDPLSGAYFHLGPEEHFLLSQLDGSHDSHAIRTAFAHRFGHALSLAELDEFVATAQAQNLLLELPEPDGSQTDDELIPSRPRAAHHSQLAASPAPRQGLLYWRKSLFDPDRVFTWLAPRLWFFWTRSFLACSATSIVLALAVLWTSRHELAGGFSPALHWETVAWVWLTILVVTLLHESAHGLTCKHFGGQVHEIGFLLMFFMPCFYCNVSDAWLFREKWKRLLVTLAGGYFELFLWSLAVFAWRVTVPGSLVHHLALVVLVSCGIQSIFHFNPLLKLDGYYLLSDWWEIPNLRERAQTYFKSQLRRLLWGAPPPALDERGPLLLGFGLVSWLYSVAFLTLILWGFFQYLWPHWGWLGLAGLTYLAVASTRGMLVGVSAGEVRNMIASRRVRTLLWLVAGGIVMIALCLIEIEDWASGPFRVRAAKRAEVRSPIAGFLQAVCCAEGDHILAGEQIARLEVPDLASRQAQKRAEVAEAQSRLKLLEIGPRPDEVAEQRLRVQRMKTWRDLATKDLEQARQALHEELARLDQQITQYRAELRSSQQHFQRAKVLRGSGALPEEQYQEAEVEHEVAQSRVAQAELQKRHRQALGTREAIAGLDAEAELARREKDLADAQATLNLLEAGSRTEEIEAERSRLARLQEEAEYLTQLSTKLPITSPVSGLVVTPRLPDKVGQYVREGDLICQVEQPGDLEVEIALAEQDVARIRAGQTVKLKARALPFDTFVTSVDRIAPAAMGGEVLSKVTVYCTLNQAPADLRTDMTGYGRVDTGRRPIGEIVLDRALRFIRTEFWW